MSSTVTPVVVSTDGQRHEPMADGAVFAASAIPLSSDRQNALTTDATGVLLRPSDLLSQADRVLTVIDGRLRAIASLSLDTATNQLNLLGVDNAVIASVRLPVVPGLPVVAEVLVNFAPPGKPSGTYMHLQFQMADGQLKDVYYDVAALVDTYTLAVSGDNLTLRDRTGKAVSSVSLAGAGEHLTSAEFLQDFTPPPPHGAASPAQPKSNYLHLHFDAGAVERDVYVDFGELIGDDPDIWGKRVAQLPEGEALQGFLEDMPVGAFVYSLYDEGPAILTKEQADNLYVALQGVQAVNGVKTFLQSPLVPTPVKGDNSQKAASTAFVQNAIGAIDFDALQYTWGKRTLTMPTGSALQALLKDMPVGAYLTVVDDGAPVVVYLTAEEARALFVALAGDQAISGTKTFSASPLVPTPDAEDSSAKAANTAFVSGAIAAAHANDTAFVRLTGDQSVNGVKTFTASPQVPTAPDGDNTLNAASTQFVTGAIAKAHAGSPTLVRTSGDQTIDGVKTFLESPVVPTQTSGDDSQHAASTAFVQQALRSAGAAPDSVVALTGDQTISGVKTFTASPEVPTPALSDSSDKAATTSFVANSLNGAVKLTGAQTISDVKTFSTAPLVPVQLLTDDSQKAANTAFVHDVVESYKWGVHIAGPLPEGAALASLLAGLPEGSFVVTEEE